MHVFVRYQCPIMAASIYKRMLDVQSMNKEAFVMRFRMETLYYITSSKDYKNYVKDMDTMISIFLTVYDEILDEKEICISMGALEELLYHMESILMDVNEFVYDVCGRRLSKQFPELILAAIYSNNFNFIRYLTALQSRDRNTLQVYNLIIDLTESQNILQTVVDYHVGSN